jgi:predicted enzyme related to lactoylglutathione lyase
MIQRISHASLLVEDQDVALDFYVNKLGFESRMDVDMGGWRWLTVSPKSQPDLELILLPIRRGTKPDEATVAQITELLRSGKMPVSVMRTADCRKTYEDLSAKGVEFDSPPKDQFYGIEAILKDPFGNRFSLTQPKQQP